MILQCGSDRRDRCPAAYPPLLGVSGELKTSCSSLLWESGPASAGLLFAGALGLHFGPAMASRVGIPTLGGTDAPVLASYVNGTQVRLQ